MWTEKFYLPALDEKILTAEVLAEFTEIITRFTRC